MQDLKRPYLLRNPQLLTALITSIGAIIGVFLLVSDSYFKAREQNNAFQERETKRLNEEAKEAGRNASQAEQDASRLIAAANQTKAEAEKRIRESKLETKVANDQLLAARKQLGDVKGDLALAHAQQLLASALRDDFAFLNRLGATARDPDYLPSKAEQEAISAHDAEFQRQLSAARKAAIEAWSEKPSSDARDAILRAYSFPISSILSTETDTAVWFLADGRFASTGDPGIRIWDATNGKSLGGHTLSEHTTTWSLFPGGRGAILIGDNRVFDVAAGKEIANWGWLPKDAEVLDVSTAFGRLATGTVQREHSDLGFGIGVDCLVQFWDTLKHREVFRAEFGPLKSPSYWAVRMSPDGRLLLVLSYPAYRGETGSTDSQVLQVFDAQTGRKLASLESSTPVHGASFSPDSRRIVATTSDTGSGPTVERGGPFEFRWWRPVPGRSGGFLPASVWWW